MSIFNLDSRDVRLTLNGFPLYGMDDNGCEWHVTFQDVSGLFDGVESTLKTGTKIATSGWYSNVPVLGGRNITVEGYILGRCTEGCLRSWDALKRTVDSTGMLLTVGLGDISRQTRVMQGSSAPLVKWAGVNMLKFSLSLVALSPYLFGMDVVEGTTGLPMTSGGMVFPNRFEDKTSGLRSEWIWGEEVISGQVRLTNVGTAPSPVTVRIDGPVVNPQISHLHTGRVMAFNTRLGAGHYLIADSRTHEVLFDGVEPARGRVVRREWSEAAVGENVWGFSAREFSDMARVTVSFYPAYL